MKTQIIEEISQVARYLWEKGWAERNAGNISLNVTGILAENHSDAFDLLASEPLKVKYPLLKGNYFIITPTGSRMRELTRNTIENLCYIRINDEGDGYTHLPSAVFESLFPVQSYTGGAKMESVFPVPSSELPAHLAIHEMFLREQPENKAVIHTHTTELIALTQISSFQSSASINKLLWGMHPETVMFVPKGSGFVPYTLPGTEAIAAATVEELKQHPMVIWEKHGVFATGESITSAFDTIDLMAKSARIYFMVRQSGYEPEGLTDEQIRELRAE